MANKIIKVDLKDKHGQPTLRFLWQLGEVACFAFWPGIIAEHAQYCETKHGFSCDCWARDEQKVVLSIRHKKKRVLVKGMWNQHEYEFRPNNAAKLFKLMEFVPSEAI